MLLDLDGGCRNVDKTRWGSTSSPTFLAVAFCLYCCLFPKDLDGFLILESLFLS